MIFKSERNEYRVEGKTVINETTGREIPKSTKTYRRCIRFARGERTPELQRRFQEVSN